MLIALTTSVSATTYFSDNFDRANCSGDCWGTPTIGGTYTYINNNSANFTINSGKGIVNDTLVSGDPKVVSSFNRTTESALYWSFDLQYNKTNGDVRFYIRNSTSSEYLMFRVYSGSYQIYDGGSYRTIGGTPSINTFANYEIYIYMNLDYAEIYKNSVLIGTQSIKASLNNFNQIYIGTDGAYSATYMEFDNISITSYNVAPTINSNTTIPIIPSYNNLVNLSINVTDTDSDISWCNFTAVHPDSTLALNNVIGNNISDVWNSTSFTANQIGVYNWSINCSDGILTTFLNESFTITNSLPVINSNTTIPIIPLLNQNVNLSINVTDTDSDISWCNFTAVHPDSTLALNNVIGNNISDVWNSTSFTANQIGVYNWNVTCSDGINTTFLNETFTITNSLPTINSNTTIPTTPLLNYNVNLSINVTDTDSNISWCNFTATLPNGTMILNNSLGNNISDVWNSTSFLATQGGSYEWNVTCSDNISTTFLEETFSIINNSLTMDAYNISIQEPSFNEPVTPYLNFTTDYETYNKANISIYVNDVLNTSYELTCDNIDYHSYNCSGIPFNASAGTTRYDFFVEYNATINVSNSTEFYVDEKIYSSPDDSYSMAVFNSTAYNKKFNISIWQGGTYALDYNLTCSFAEANITIVNKENATINGTSIDDATKVQVNVSASSLEDGIYNGSCNITRKTDNTKKQINLTYFKNPPMAQIKLIHPTSGTDCANTLLGTCSFFKLEYKSDNTFSENIKINNFGEYSAKECNAYLDNDYVGLSTYTFNESNFTIEQNTNRSIKVTFSNMDVNSYQGNLYVRCENASGFGYSVENEPSNRPVYYLSISTPTITPPDDGDGSGGSDPVIPVVLGNCSDIDLEPTSVKFTSNALKEINIFNNQDASYSPEVSITGDIKDFIQVTNLVTLLPNTGSKFGIRYDALNFTEGEALVTLTDTCGIKEIFVTAQITDSSNIFELLSLDTWKEFLSEPVFGESREDWRENSPLFNVSAVWIIMFLIMVLLLSNSYSNALKDKKYVQFSFFILFTIFASFILMIVVISLMRLI